MGEVVAFFYDLQNSFTTDRHAVSKILYNVFKNMPYTEWKSSYRALQLTRFASNSAKISASRNTKLKAEEMVKAPAYVAEMTDAYDEEGYESMSMDTYRNRYFIMAIASIRNQGLSDFIEIGPGADAKLTHYILGSRSDIVNAKFRDASKVLAIETNRKSFDKATQSLRHYKNRAKVIHGDAVKVLANASGQLFDCLVAEVIGFVASCEGQCRLVYTVKPFIKPAGKFVPRRFSTYLVAYTGELPAAVRKDNIIRVRHRAFTRLFKNKHVEKNIILTLEEWDSETIEAAMPATFHSTAKMPFGVTSLIGYIRLDQGKSSDAWCSSAPWHAKKHRATNWDIFVIKLPPHFSGSKMHLESKTSTFQDNPHYSLKFTNTTRTTSAPLMLNFSTRDLVNMDRVG